MIERMFSGRPPTITFTHDFHELLNGDLRPGSRLTLRYDPLRLVPKEPPYLFGDPGKPLIAHAAFRKGGAAVSKPLVSEAGPLPHPVVDVTGRGSMLSASFDIPEDAEAVILWFSYDCPVTGLHFDSDLGRNFWFPFVSRQIKLVAADVVTASGGAASDFALTVAAITDIDRVTVRAHLLTSAAPLIPDPDLARTGETDEAGWALWAGRTAVPLRAVIRFKLFYWLRGIQYKDDNSGRYYLAPQPPAETVPPPSKELADAAAKWRL